MPHHRHRPDRSPAWRVFGVFAFFFTVWGVGVVIALDNWP